MLESTTQKVELQQLLTLTKTEQILQLSSINHQLEQMTAQQRVSKVTPV